MKLNLSLSKNNILCSWSDSFISLFYLRNRDYFLETLYMLVEELSEYKTINELFILYRKRYSYFDYLNISEMNIKYTTRIQGLLEDSAFYIRFFEIINKKNYHVDKKINVLSEILREKNKTKK